MEASRNKIKLFDMKQEQIPYGSDLKILVEVTDLGEGTALAGIPYTLEFSAGSAKKTFAVTIEAPDEEEGTEGGQVLPPGLKSLNDHKVVASIPAADLDRGDLWLKVTLQIPDEDFESGYRTDIREIDQHITIY